MVSVLDTGEKFLFYAPKKLVPVLNCTGCDAAGNGTFDAITHELISSDDRYLVMTEFREMYSPGCKENKNKALIFLGASLLLQKGT